MSDKKQTVDLGLLEEDDEFEEFPAEGKLTKISNSANGHAVVTVDMATSMNQPCNSDSASIAMLLLTLAC